MILEIKAWGMCSSDLHNYRAPAHAPGTVTGGIKREAGMIAGHEPCGIVAAVGSAVTEKEARVGQRVMDHHYDGCGTCKHCRAGWTQMCLAGNVAPERRKLTQAFGAHEVIDPSRAQGENGARRCRHQNPRAR